MILQNQLCEKCNTRFAKSSDDETEEEARHIKGEGLKNP